jgi:hypothetical protein
LLVENYVQSPRLCLTTFLNCWSRNGHTKHNTTPLHTTHCITAHHRTTHRVRLASAHHGWHDASKCEPVTGRCCQRASPRCGHHACQTAAAAAPAAAAGAPVLTTSSTTQCTGAARSTHCAGARLVFYWCSPRLSPYIIPVLAASSTTMS